MASKSPWRCAHGLIPGADRSLAYAPVTVTVSSRHRNRQQRLNDHGQNRPSSRHRSLRNIGCVTLSASSGNVAVCMTTGPVKWHRQVVLSLSGRTIRHERYERYNARWQSNIRTRLTPLHLSPRAKLAALPHTRADGVEYKRQRRAQEEQPREETCPRDGAQAVVQLLPEQREPPSERAAEERVGREGRRSDGAVGAEVSEISPPLTPQDT